MTRSATLARLAAVLFFAGCDPAASADVGVSDAPRDTAVPPDAPTLDAPGSDAPDLDAPPIDAPAVDAPELDAPSMDDAPSPDDTGVPIADAPDAPAADPCDPPPIGPSRIGLESCDVEGEPVVRSLSPGGSFDDIVRALVVSDDAVILQSGDDTERFLVSTEAGRCVLRRDEGYVPPASIGGLVDVDADGTLYFSEPGGLRYAGTRTGFVAGIAAAFATRSASRDGIVFLTPSTPGQVVRVDTLAGTSAMLPTLGVRQVATFGDDLILRSSDCETERVDASGARVWCNDAFDYASQRVVRCGDDICMQSGSDSNRLFYADGATGEELPFEIIYYSPGRTREVPLDGYDSSPDGQTFMSVGAIVSPTCAPGPTAYLLHFARATF